MTALYIVIYVFGVLATLFYDSFYGFGKEFDSECGGPPIGVLACFWPAYLIITIPFVFYDNTFGKIKKNRINKQNSGTKS